MRAAGALWSLANIGKEESRFFSANGAFHQAFARHWSYTYHWSNSNCVMAKRFATPPAFYGPRSYRRKK